MEKLNQSVIFFQIVDYDDPCDQRQEWFPERRALVTDPTFAGAIDFYNIYHQSWILIKQGKMLMHCENITFAYEEYMKVKGAVSEDILIISLMLELESSYQRKERNIFLNYLRNEIQSILNNLMKILMIIHIMMV